VVKVARMNEMNAVFAVVSDLVKRRKGKKMSASAKKERKRVSREEEEQNVQLLS
jgi:hypothetical protein